MSLNQNPEPVYSFFILFNGVFDPLWDTQFFSLVFSKDKFTK